MTIDPATLEGTIRKVRTAEEQRWGLTGFKFYEVLALCEAAETFLCPVPMILHCPRCGLQHVDAPSEGWDNPPHRSHLCHGCGCIWRPADVPTCGVRKIATTGSADTWAPQSTSVDVVGYVDISLSGFLNDPPDDDYQRGYLSALLFLWREGLHRDSGEDRLTRLGDMARSKQ